MEIVRARRGVLALATALALAGALAASLALAAGSGGQVKVGKTALGRILVDARGHTLYMFAVDRHDKSACYGACAAFWPPLLAASTSVHGSGVKASLLGTTMRTGGKLQVTYNGHPLYRFAKDAKAGQTNGQGLNAAGGLWWVLSPAGKPIKRKAAAPPPTTTTTTSPYPGGYGGGYGP